MKKLWLDLGNTRLKYWIVDNDTIIAHHAKEHLKAPNELLLGLLGTLASFEPEFVGISSVLGDKINTAIAQTLQGFAVPFEFAKVNANHPLLTSHYDPNQLGVDRWLQMLGAVDNTKKQCVVGCGTALTIDLIEHGTHLGGYICNATPCMQALSRLRSRRGGLTAPSLGRQPLMRSIMAYCLAWWGRCVRCRRIILILRLRSQGAVRT